MSKINNTDEKKDTTPQKVAINTIQRTALVERLCVKKFAWTRDEVIPYDLDNLYPNKIKNIALRSGSTMAAIETFANHMRGDGIEGNDTEVNKDKQTLWKILSHMATSWAIFGGMALHFNYNMFGEIAEINPVPFEFVRWKKDKEKLIVNPDWGNHRRFKSEEKEYYPFNPENVGKEIEESGGFDKYTGQIYYWIPNKEDIYTVTCWDSVIDDAQMEAEIKLYSLSSIQNDYSLSGIITYPVFLESTDEGKKVINELRKDIGAGNAGGVRLIASPTSDEMRNHKWFTPISRNNIDQLFTNQRENAMFNIYARFRQPPILNGISKDGMFNQDQFNDAFEYYNSQTETERKDIEKELNKILELSIWSDLAPVEIIPKSLIIKENKSNGEVIDNDQ